MDLLERFWQLLPPGSSPDRKLVSSDWLKALYAIGFVEHRRLSPEKWEGFFSAFPEKSGAREVQKPQLLALKPFLHQGPLKRPFDPAKLKLGWRSEKWIDEIYEKVLRFETSQGPEAWKQWVQNTLPPQFRRAGKINYNEDFVKLLKDLLDQLPSPLRQLELFFHEGRLPQLSSSPNKPEAYRPSAPQDAFVAKPEELLRKAQMEKLYYHYEQHPLGDDQEDLEFLEELVSAADEEPLPSGEEPQKPKKN